MVTNTKISEEDVHTYFISASLKKAAQQGHFEACYQYYKCLSNGIGVDPNHDAALCYLQFAAECGYPPAEAEYATHFTQPGASVESVRFGIEYHKRAATHGDPVGMLYYGMLLYKGEFVAKDKEAGLNYIKRSADLGNFEAMANYALLLWVRSCETG